MTPKTASELSIEEMEAEINAIAIEMALDELYDSLDGEITEAA